MSYQFQNANLTEGITGRYNMLGNMGSPRISRLFMARPVMNDFIFADPFDFFIKQPGEFHFTNTLSPITNVTYDECGDKTDGEDRIKAFFAVNAGKNIGLDSKSITYTVADTMRISLLLSSTEHCTALTKATNTKPTCFLVQTT